MPHSDIHSMLNSSAQADRQAGKNLLVSQEEEYIRFFEANPNLMGLLGKGCNQFSYPGIDYRSKDSHILLLTIGAGLCKASDISKIAGFHKTSDAHMHNQEIILAYIQNNKLADQLLKNYPALSNVLIDPQYMVSQCNEESWKLYFAGRNEGVITKCTEAISYNKQDNAESFELRGMAYQATEKYDNAIQDYTTAINKRRGPYDDQSWDNELIFVNRGDAYFQKGDYQNAIQDYTRSIEINKQGADSDRNMALQSRKEDNKIRYFYEAIQKDWRNADIYLKRGRAYQAMGDNLKATEDLQEALRLKPNLRDVVNPLLDHLKESVPVVPSAPKP